MNGSRGGMLRPNRILLATDGSPDAELAARVATDLSRKTGAELHVAHAWMHHARGFGYPGMLWTDYSYLYEREARRRIKEQVDAIEAAGGDVYDQHLVQGPTIDALLDLFEEAQPGLVVMGSRGLGPVGRVGLGSVSEGVAHHARHPVLVLRGAGAAWPPGLVIVGDDGSEAAGRAAEISLGIGALYGAGELLVRAYRNPPQPIGGWSADDRRRLDEVKTRIEKALDERAEAVGRDLGRRPKTRVFEGDTALALLAAAEEGEEAKTLISVGSRGLGAIGRARLGSVSTSVLRAATGPVLVCPRPREAVRAEAPPSEVSRPAEVAR